MGESNESALKGIGIFMWDSGEVYFGQWDGGVQCGEGIMYLSTGAFVRACFKDGYLEGTAYLKPNQYQSYLMKMDLGVLHGEVTVFKKPSGNVKVIEYEEGEILRVIKEEENYVHKCKNIILNTVFGIEEEVLSQVENMSENISEIEGSLIGSFKISDRRWYHGNVVNGQPQGLGILHEMGGKVQIGWFEAGNLQGFGRIIWPNGITMDGTIADSKIEGSVIVYNAGDHTWMEAEALDNKIVKKKSSGDGFPADLRGKMAKENLYQFQMELFPKISPVFYYEDEDQEMAFHVSYGEFQNGDGGEKEWPNLLEFEFTPSGLSSSSRQGGMTLDQSGGSKKGLGIVRVERMEVSGGGRQIQSQTWQAGGATGGLSQQQQQQQQGATQQSGISNIFHSNLPPQSDSDRLDSLAFTLGSSSKKNESIQRHQYGYAQTSEGKRGAGVGMSGGVRAGVGMGIGGGIQGDVQTGNIDYEPRNLSRQFEEENSISQKSQQLQTPNQDYEQSQYQQIYQQTSQQQGQSGHDAFKNSKKEQNILNGFDALDIILMQRSLNLSANSDTHTTRKVSNKRRLKISGKRAEDCEKQVIANYVKNFMNGFIRKDKIKTSMSWMKGYQDRFLKQQNLKNISTFQLSQYQQSNY